MSKDDDKKPGEDKDKPNGKKKDEVHEDHKGVEPVPKREDFFKWLFGLFEGAAQFPEKIETRIVSGPRYERLGPMVKQVQFAPNDPKPQPSKIVALSNELLFLMQRDCDIHGKSTVYGAHAAHFARDSDYYERFLIRCQPKAGGRSANDGLAVIERDEAEDNLDQQYKIQFLRHDEKMFELYGGGYEGLLDRYDRAERQDRDEIQRLRTENASLRDQLERALSLKEEREARRRWQEIGMKAAEEGIDMGKNLLPPLLNQFVGKQVLPTNGTTPEIYTLRTFFKLKSEGGSLTEEQANAAFGEYEKEPPHKMTRRGVLTEDQAGILFRVAHGQMDPNALDDLLPPEGKCAVTMEQLGALQQIFSMAQLAPLQIIFQDRMNRKTKKA